MEVETSHHLFLFCEVSRNVWNSVMRWLEFMFITPPNMLTCNVGVTKNQKENCRNVIGLFDKQQFGWFKMRRIVKFIKTPLRRLKNWWMKLRSCLDFGHWWAGRRCWYYSACNGLSCFFSAADLVCFKGTYFVELLLSGRSVCNSEVLLFNIFSVCWLCAQFN